MRSYPYIIISRGIETENEEWTALATQDILSD